MKGSMAIVLVWAAALLSPAGPALGIIASGVPADFVGYWTGADWSFANTRVYKWNGSSAVAVGKYWLLTSGHVGGYVGLESNFDGTVRTVTQVLTPPPDAGQSLVPDLALIRLNLPLAGWERLYNGSYSFADPRTPTIVIGYGYSGQARQSECHIDPSTPQIKRWGTNAMDAQVRLSVTSYNSLTDVMWYNNTSTYPDTEFEATFADGDSGGETFVKVGNEWRLCGVNAYIGGIAGFPNRSYVIDVPTYYRWITTSMTVPGDTNFDMSVDFADYQRLEVNFGLTAGADWEMGDFNNDRAVDFADYQAMEAHFGEHAPEPATAGLLLAGAAMLALRRRG